MVVEFELLLGSFARRVTLKVAKGEDIDALARRYLSGALRYRGREGINLIAIAVDYRKEEEDRLRKLNVTVRGTSGSNVQNHKDRRARFLASRLLEAWGIARSLRPLNRDEAKAMLPGLLKLFDLGDEVLTGLLIKELGLSVDELLGAQLISQKSRQPVTLADAEGDEVIEQEVSRSVPSRSTRDYTNYKIATGWLRETIAKRLSTELDFRDFRPLSERLSGLGTLMIGGQPVSVFLARDLMSFKSISALEMELSQRAQKSTGLILGASPEAPRYIGHNVVIPIGTVMEPGDPDLAIDLDRLRDRYESDRKASKHIVCAKVFEGGNNTGSFVMPDKPALPLTGRIQLDFFTKLADAYNAGFPEVHASILVEGTSASTPRAVFSGKMRKRVFDDYVERARDNGCWRLKG
ncbi:hypothetical protein DU478_21510 [Thalassococcus profundi]|uniref:Uncharacterized protein n=1 Tax=Thalassococcus profundi TaxID=2282382 RepID=A0A369TFU7_9RHOB|nr:hypothetical protein [Thalassococcus profundi]RDD64193.1 hypothetical protein DU478_21510 [Thalassococcus profundi]